MDVTISQVDNGGHENRPAYRFIVGIFKLPNNISVYKTVWHDVNTIEYVLVVVMDDDFRL
jgi:hypothetical protein